MAAAAETHADTVSAGLTAVLTPMLGDGETLPDLMRLQELLARLLKRRQLELVLADKAHAVETVDDQDPRLRRDQAAEALRTKLVEVRGLVAALFGGAGSRRLLVFQGDTPRDSKALLQQAEVTMERLRELRPEPSAATGGAQIDPSFWVGQIEPLYQELETALAEVVHERRRAERTLLEKQRVMASHDLALGSVARVLEGFYELAGFPELADRVRPATRRPSPAEAEPEPVPLPPDTAGDGGAQEVGGSPAAS